LQIIRGFIGQEAFFTNVPYDVFSLTLSFFFLQSTFFSKNPTLNGPGWSVSAEIIMYILFYFLVKKTRKNILYFLATSGALVFLGIYTVLRNIDIPPLGATTTGRALIGFFMGCILYFLNQFYVKLDHKKKKIILSLLMSWMLIVITLGIKFGSSIYGELSPFYSICIYSPLIFLAVNFRALRKFLSLKPFRTLGDASYAIYLLNFPLLILINTMTSVFDIQLNFYSKKIFLLHLVALVALSIIVHNFFEKPITYKLKNWLISINHKKIVRKLNISIK
ncbi:MAG: acyltransferase, partial [Candidatus Saccharibacteria bacterium]|nr:acyltransferase [Candidatus Saccharibacteria bacterium]